jgi:signal transduction histidine kinase
VELSLQIVPIEEGHVVSIARDITDRKLAELEREHLYTEALNAVRARDDFLSIASHELRTPLSSLQLQVQLLLRPPRGQQSAAISPDQLRDKLKVAARQVDRLNRLIDQLMDVSRISAGKLRIEVEPLDLGAVARDVVGRFKDDAAKAGSEVIIGADAPVVGTWDRLRMEQVITNLLGNALKFGNRKPIEIHVSNHGGGARLSVRDHGIGIAPEDVDRVFQRFERACTPRNYAGLGLGLYIVHQIVDAHGGTIRVESQPGTGSTFTVDLPLAPPALKNEEPAQDVLTARETSARTPSEKAQAAD